MKFCSVCGSAVELRTPENDNRLRHVCIECNVIHYQNPKMVVGCLPIVGDKILLCKRAIEPRYGYWTLPAGFLENGEDTFQGAARETFEEAGAVAIDDGLYTIYDLPHISQIYFFFRARLENDAYAVGEESLDVALFAEDEIPWKELAFPVVAKTLRHYFSDRQTGQYPVRREVVSFIPPRQF